MSHGGGEDNIEPDLTPLLDLVMQLLMFFIINVNFVSNATDADTDLPTAGSARPEENDPKSIFLDLRTLKGVRGAANRSKLPQAFRDETRQPPVEVNIPNKLKFQDSYIKYALAAFVEQQYKTQLETKGWLLDMARELKKTPEAKDKEGKLATTIHIRPDGDIELNQLFSLMQACKVAGFRNIKVHAYIGE